MAMTKMPKKNHSDSQPEQAIPLAKPVTENEHVLQEWIAGISDGDQIALGMLYDSLVHQVYGLCLHITQRPALAEEVVQDAFWQVWRQAPRFDRERGSVKTWVMTIARSRALDALRAIEGKEQELDPETWDLFSAPEHDTPLNLLASQQEGLQLQTVLAALDPTARQLVGLAFFRGLSHEEISVCSGLPLGTVKSHIRRALLTLQQLLN
jgi:RNA polymerase sigma-70 factor (ECF subfamily)